MAGYMGMLLRERRGAGRIAGVSVASAFLFFAISNFGVWLVWYPHTFSALADCYIKALPFLRNTLLSTLAYSAALFGAYAMAARAAEGTRYKEALFADRH